MKNITRQIEKAVINGFAQMGHEPVPDEPIGKEIVWGSIGLLIIACVLFLSSL